MRLSENEIRRIVQKLISEWSRTGIYKAKDAVKKTEDSLCAIFAKELKREDDLNADVEKLLTQYEDQFESGKLDRRKMFSMVKAQLAKERKITL